MTEPLRGTWERALTIALRVVRVNIYSTRLGNFSFVFTGATAFFRGDTIDGSIDFYI